MARPVFNLDTPRVASQPNIEFVLDELYRANFGTWALPFRTQPSERRQEALPEKGQPNEKKPWGDFKPGEKGQIYRMPIAIRPADGADAWFQLPNEPMISVEGGVDIVKTTIDRGNGKYGTVTEEERLTNEAVRIQGICYNQLENSYPEEDMKLINYYMRRPGYLEVKNYLLNQVFGIQFIKIERRRAERSNRLTERWAPYVLECYSVEDFDLT